MKTFSPLIAALSLLPAGGLLFADAATQPTEAMRLLDLVSDPSKPFKEREAAVETLRKIPAPEVLPPLADIFDGLPDPKKPVGINEMGVRMDLERIWLDHLRFTEDYKVTQDAEATLVKMLKAHPQRRSSRRIIEGIASAGDNGPLAQLGGQPLQPETAQALEAEMLDSKLNESIRLEAAEDLEVFGRKYEPEMVALASRSPYEMKVRLVETALGALQTDDQIQEEELLIFGDRKAKPTTLPSAVDPALARLAYGMIDEEIAQHQPRQGWIQAMTGILRFPPPAGYDAADAFGKAVHVDFGANTNPDHDEATLQANYQRTIQNARDWWAKHKESLAATQPAEFQRKD
jgi:hypothetical protein